MAFFRTILTNQQSMLINMKNVSKVTLQNKTIELEFMNHSGFGIFGSMWFEPKNLRFYYETDEAAKREFDRMEKTTEMITQRLT